MKKLCIVLAIALMLCIGVTTNAETNAEQYENAIGLLKDNKFEAFN